MAKKKKFSQREKRKHYSDVAKGKKPTKKDSKFSKQEQIAYAKGQANARNESAGLFKWWKNRKTKKANTVSKNSVRKKPASVHRTRPEISEKFTTSKRAKEKVYIDTNVNEPISKEQLAYIADEYLGRTMQEKVDNYIAHMDRKYGPFF